MKNFNFCKILLKNIHYPKINLYLYKNIYYLKNINLTTNELIKELGALRKFMLEFIATHPEKEYSSFIRELLNNNFYYDEQLKFPSLKEILLISNLSRARIRKFLESAYVDVKNEDFLFNIHKIKYVFIVKNFNNHLYKEFSNIPRVPNIGERVDFPYFKEELMCSLMYVDDVSNEFTDDLQIVTIYLKCGEYNLHWRLRKDEAKEYRELGIIEFYEEDYILKTKLDYGKYKKKENK